MPGSFLGADDLRLLLLPVFFRALGTPFWEVFRNRLLPARCLLRDPIEVARLPLGEFGRRLDMLGATAES